MKDFGKLILEQVHYDVSGSAIAGGALGAGVGGVRSLMHYVAAVHEAKKRLKNCGDNPECVKRAKESLKKTRTDAIKHGVSQTILSGLGSATLSGGFAHLRNQ